MPRLLVIDDEESVRYSFHAIFEDDDVSVVSARTAAEGLELARTENPDVIVLDIQLPDGDGMELFPRLKALDPKRPILFITAHGTAELAIQAMRQGAFDYLLKPLDLERLSQLLAAAFETARIARVPARLTAPQDSGDRIVGRSHLIQDMCKMIGRVAPQDVSVLIVGESGVGKELVARALFQHSTRVDKPFLPLNCAAIPEAMLESELFGHEQGAFTGAQRRRIGKFEQCDGGTIFLDEIGEMAPNLQAKMLRLLQDQTFERLGGNEQLSTNVRILAATNLNLEQAVESGQFRKDLYYRLKGITIRVPPLREHPEDISELAHYFLFRFQQSLNLAVRDFSPEALEALQRYSWPGNVRELQGVIRQAMLSTVGQVVPLDALPKEVWDSSVSEASDQTRVHEIVTLVDQLIADGQGNLHERAVSVLERILFTRVLQHTAGNQTLASALLGLSRNTLRVRMKALGFAIERVLNENDEPPGKSIGRS